MGGEQVYLCKPVLHDLKTTVQKLENEKVFKEAVKECKDKMLSEIPVVVEADQKAKSETKQRKVQVLEELPHQVQQMEHFKEHKMNVKKSLMPVLSSLKE